MRCVQLWRDCVLHLYQITVVLAKITCNTSATWAALAIKTSSMKWWCFSYLPCDVVYIRAKSIVRTLTSQMEIWKMQWLTDWFFHVPPNVVICNNWLNISITLDYMGIFDPFYSSCTHIVQLIWLEGASPNTFVTPKYILNRNVIALFGRLG